ncbi:helix-turn-helix domain-containing protein [Candidatus Daviesbacteria bacterium]|nr:helix-turn-helix domain-containing protein [Candidatus Daviesbacteria bacterium]
MATRNQNDSSLRGFLDVNEAAKYLGLSPKTIRRWARLKKINGLKLGSRGDWRFTKEELHKVFKKLGGVDNA